jgi:hypothetical protein
MSAKKKPIQSELIEAPESPWQVRVAIHERNHPSGALAGSINHAGRHVLYYKKRRMLSGKGAGHLDRFQRLAAHFNATSASPKAAIECAADCSSLDTALAMRRRRDAKAALLQDSAPPPRLF